MVVATAHRPVPWRRLRVPLRAHVRHRPREPDLDAPVKVGPIRVDRALAQPLERLGRGMAVVVVGARRDDGHARADRVEQRRRRGRSRAMVGDLEQVDRRQATREERRVHVLLEVAREQESEPAGLAQEHDRGVVDALAIRRGSRRDGFRVRPENAEADPVDRQSIPGREPAARRPARLEHVEPRLVAGSTSRQAGFVGAPHPVSLEDQRQARNVVLVGMGEHDDVDPAIPRRQPLVERLQESSRVRPAVDHHPPAATALDEDRVALPDIQQRDRCYARRAIRGDERQPQHRGDQQGGRNSWQPGASRRASVPARSRSRGQRARRRGRSDHQRTGMGSR